MAKKTRVELDSNGIRDLLLGEGVASYLRERAGAVASAARSGAPVKSGSYRDSIHVRVVTRADRTVAQVAVGVPYGALIEARTGNLARALDSA